MKRLTLEQAMSSKYLLSALLMEFGEQLRHSGVRGAPRGSGFNPVLRLRVIPPVGRWFILDEALVLGEAAENEKKKHQAEDGSKRQVKGKRKKPEDRLRLKDPW